MTNIIVCVIEQTKIYEILIRHLSMYLHSHLSVARIHNTSYVWGLSYSEQSISTRSMTDMWFLLRVFGTRSLSFSYSCSLLYIPSRFRNLVFFTDWSLFLIRCFRFDDLVGPNTIYFYWSSGHSTRFAQVSTSFDEFKPVPMRFGRACTRFNQIEWDSTRFDWIRWCSTGFKSI